MPNRTQPPAIHDFEHLSLPECVVTEPHPGLRVHMLDAGELPANSVVVTRRFGDATAGCRMATHMLPTLMTEGTRHMSGAALSDTIEYNGSWLQSGVTNHYARLGMTSLNEATPQMLSLLGDMLCEPMLPAEAFESTRAREAAARRLVMTKVDGVAADTIIALLAGQGHPYLSAVSPETIEAVTINDIRHQAEQVLRHTAVDIFAVGRLGDGVLKAIENMASRLAPADTANDTIIVHGVTSAPCRVDKTMEGRLQSAVRIAIPTCGRTHPDYEDLHNVVIALGGYFGSRLMTVIREQMGLTYGIQASLNGMPEVNYVSIDAQCDPANVSPAIDAIAEQMLRLGREPMDDDELRRLRSEVMTRLASTLDSPLSIMNFHRTMVTGFIPKGYFNRRFQSIRRLTADRICEIATRYLDPSRAIIVTCGA